MLRASILPLAVALSACSPRAILVHEAAPAADPCLIEGARGATNDSVVIAVEGDIDRAHAPRPRNGAERFVFAQVYETLVRVRCDGMVVPGLADSWTGDSAGRQWTLTLRDGARFSDGTVITARDVAAAWRDRASDSGTTSVRGEILEGIAVIGDREISVHFRHPQPDGPAALAHPSLAIHRPMYEAWPAGSGAYLPPDSNPLSPDAAAASLALRPRNPDRFPSLVVRALRGANGRDLIDQGVDVLLARDGRVVLYAATRQDLRATALEPDRVHLLLTMQAPTAARQDDDSAAWRAFRESLAGDLAGERLVAGDGEWWGARAAAASSCAADGATQAPALMSSARRRLPRRIVHEESDRVAGELAKRIVALVAFDRGSISSPSAVRTLIPEMFADTIAPLVAAPVPVAVLARSLARGADFAYLLTLPRRSLAPCAAATAFAAAVPWSAAEDPAVLGESGPVLLVSRRAPAMTRDWDNTLRPVASAPLRASPP